MLGDHFDLLFSLFDKRILFLRYSHIRNGDRKSGTGRILVAHFLDCVEHRGGGVEAVNLDASVDDFSELSGCGNKHDLKIEKLCGIGTVNVSEILRNVAVEDETSESSVDYAALELAVNLLLNADLDRRVKSEKSVLIRHHRLVEVAEHLALAGLSRFIERQVERTEHHILRRNGDRTSVDGLEEVVRGKHEESCLCLSLCGKRNVNRHLVAVEVRVERLTNERMKLYRLTLDEHGLKRLDRQTVKRRRTVEKHGMLFDNILESVPDFDVHLFDFLLCFLDVRRLLRLNKALHNERLKQLKRHLLRQTALIDLQVRSDDDNASSRVVDSLTEKVLTEASLLTSEHFGERLERSV